MGGLIEESLSKLASVLVRWVLLQDVRSAINANIEKTQADFLACN